ncbi:hypothetical protein, partial [Aeromonas caviae]
GVFGDSQFTSTLSVNFHFPKIPRRTIFFPFLLVFHGFGMEHRHRMLGYRPSLLVRFCTLVVVSSNALRKAELTGKQQPFISSIS